MLVYMLLGQLTHDNKYMCNQTANKSFKYGGVHLPMEFSVEESQIDETHLKMCSVSSAIRRLHHKPDRNDEFNNTDDS